VGYINGEYVLNPGQTQRKDSQMDLVVAGTEAAVLMVESEAQQLSEEVMLGAVVFGHEQSKIAINAIHELVRDAGKPAWDWQPPAKDEPSSPRSTPWPKKSCAPPTRSAASRPAPRPARSHCLVMAALKADAYRIRRGQGGRAAVRHRSQDRAQPDPGGRAPHRRP
jgi:polyribonucleotide nucleotidyltransferase